MENGQQQNYWSALSTKAREKKVTDKLSEIYSESINTILWKNPTSIPIIAT